MIKNILLGVLCGISFALGFHVGYGSISFIAGFLGSLICAGLLSIVANKQ